MIAAMIGRNTMASTIACGGTLAAAASTAGLAWTAMLSLSSG